MRQLICTDRKLNIRFYTDRRATELNRDKLYRGEVKPPK